MIPPRMIRNVVFGRLHAIQCGSLSVRGDGSIRVVGDGAAPIAEVHLRDPRFYEALFWGGHIGAAEAYAAGWWTTPDLTSVIRLFIRNRDALNGLETGAAQLLQLVRRVAHAARPNTRRGSRRNIRAHYDLGNEFFSLFLDETLTYSCGYFEQDRSTLGQASRAKYDRICRRLGLRSDHHIVEIGCGWGGFAIHAAQTYGCRVTALTISDEQFRLARERVQAAGLAERVSVLLRDYRDMDGTFDRLVSIEMIEAVGHRYFRSYFEQCARLLVPDGLAAIQSITIQPRFYERARREVDFIKKYIFPGSCIPSIPALARSWASTDLRLVHAEDLGPHYARTLREWSHRFGANHQTLAQLGYDEWFQRIWQFYFAYCEAGFEERTIGVSQLIFAKPWAVRDIRSSAQDSERAA
jgi:cyclopropane-fatty-acyl-phospholipid synthase